ncbi:MAG: transcriptional regulator [Bifidobacteriaceae bacterium]|jgi:DNA-binding transcriptional regulator LsrR (DeoR family)|nr:transcriptional regulator [Bifidobacteriaceae bacterium]
MGPERQLQLAFVARRHYVEQRSKVEIAEELGLSRFQVARMLDQARERGIVKFVVELPGPVDQDLSLALKESLGLRRAVVVNTPSADAATVRQCLGRAAAALASEIITPEAVVGMTAGRTLGAMAGAVEPMTAAGVVQLSGAAGPIQATAVEVVRRFSKTCNAPVYPLYCPLLASDPAAARVLRRQADIQRTLAKIPEVTVAWVAVGSWDPPDSELRDNPALAGIIGSLPAPRAIAADVGGIVLADDARAVREVEELCIGATAAQLRAIPDVIAVAGGARKADAVRAAVASGIVRSLVTDTTAARALLAGRSPGRRDTTSIEPRSSDDAPER